VDARTHTSWHEEGGFTSPDGVELYQQRWGPAAPARAQVVLAHGLGEHGGRYGRLVAALVESGLAVTAPDHRGHGRSPGQRGHVRRWGQYRGDLGAVLAEVRGGSEGAPLFLYGHSMGALIALDLVLEASRGEDAGSFGLDGLILSGIPLEPVGIASPWLIALARVLSVILPRMPLSPGIGPDALSRDPEVWRAYEADPLVHRRATARWGAEALATIERTKRDLGRLTLPVLAVHGGADPLNAPRGSREVIRRASSSDRTLRVYEGARHEPHNDFGWEAVVADVVAWIEARCLGTGR
jgi:alpha-beta hydrolase superfamily lysophospholipase